MQVMLGASGKSGLDTKRCESAADLAGPEVDDIQIVQVEGRREGHDIVALVCACGRHRMVSLIGKKVVSPLLSRYSVCPSDFQALATCFGTTMRFKMVLNTQSPVTFLTYY